METNNQKTITICFVLIAAVVWVVMGILLETFSATFGVVARAVDTDLVRHGLPIATALATFLTLQFRNDSYTYTDECITEIKKVVFPSRRDTTAMTIVVCFMLILSGVLLGVFDVVSGYVMNLVVN